MVESILEGMKDVENIEKKVGMNLDDPQIHGINCNTIEDEEDKYGSI